MVKKIDIGYFIFQLLATSLATHGCSYSDTFHSLPWVIMEVIARDKSHYPTRYLNTRWYWHEENRWSKKYSDGYQTYTGKFCFCWCSDSKLYYVIFCYDVNASIRHLPWSFLVFNNLWREIIVYIVDNGGIIDHHCLNFLFISYIMTSISNNNER
jgi:hypothetical protein